MIAVLISGSVSPQFTLADPCPFAQEETEGGDELEAVVLDENTVIRDLEYFPLVKHRYPNHKFEVDFEATVSHFNADWRQFYVQDGNEAIYIQLPNKILLQDEAIELGTRLRIQGSIQTSHYAIDVSSIEVLGPGTPAEPIDVNMKTLELHEHWSRRVKCECTFESILCMDDLIYANVSAEGRRFILRYSTGQNGEGLTTRARELLDSTASVTGTISYLMDSNGRAITPIVHSMPKDEVNVLKKGPQIGDDRRVEFGTEEQIAVGETVEFVGDVAHTRRFDLLVMQEATQTSRIYFAAPPDLIPGHVLRVVATRIDGELSDRTPIAEGFDSLGADCDWLARLMVVEGQGSSFADDFSSDRLVQELFESGVGSVKGDLVSVRSEGTLRFLELKDGPLEYTGMFRASDEEFEALELDRAASLKLLGYVSRDRNGDEDNFKIDVAKLSNIEVLTRRPTVDRQLVLYIVAACATLMTGAGMLVWRLTGKVGRTSADLASAVARLNSSYDAVREGIMVIDNHGNALAVNTRVTDILGLTSQLLLQENPADSTPLRALATRFIDPRPFEDAWKRAQQDPTFACSIELQTNDTVPRDIIAFTSPVRSPDSSDVAVPETRIWTFDDVSERKQLQANLIQSQKMEAVGRLAGGIAHDFNNLLLAISANLELLKMNVDANSSNEEYVDAADQAVERAAKLVKNLLRFSRKSNLEIRVGDLNEVVERTRGLVERIVGPDIELTVNLQEDLPCVRMDESHIEQVLLNLCLNASDACESEGARIRISTSVSNKRETQSRLKRDYDRELLDEYVVVIVEDNGCGMSGEVVQKAFDPFFTTKQFGKGTGLGLSISLGIVEQHHGIIQFDTQEGVGTRFEVFLPSSTQEVSTPALSLPSPENPPCSGSLLLADDEERVRTSTATALRELGFEVTSVKDGVDALIQLRSSGFDLAILDLEMPGMSGLEVVAEVQRQWPGFPVIVTSGHPQRLDELGQVDQRLAPVIAKPYRLESLIRLIKQTLDKPGYAPETQHGTAGPER